MDNGKLIFREKEKEYLQKTTFSEHQSFGWEPDGESHDLGSTVKSSILWQCNKIGLFDITEYVNIKI